MSRVIFGLILLFVEFGAAFAGPNFTDGYRKITQIYVNGTEQKKFYLDQRCPAGEAYYILKPTEVDVDVFYSTILAAFTSGQRVKVGWNQEGNHCVVQRLNVLP